MKKIVCLFLAVCIAAFTAALTAPPAFSMQLENLIDPVHAGQLRSGSGAITKAHLRNPVLQLLPQNDDLRRHVNAVMNDLGPNIAVETLYLYKKPTPAYGWTETQRINLFNRMIALSTLAGTEYFSESRGIMRTFYESSHVVDNPSNRRQLPDPVFLTPPASFSLYARQTDLTFGDNIYRYNFVATQDAFFFTMENITALTVARIPVVGRNRLRSIMAVIDCGDYLLIYAVSMARAASTLGMGDRISSSFGNRAQAILQWFTDRADEVF